MTSRLPMTVTADLQPLAPPPFALIINPPQGPTVSKRDRTVTFRPVVCAIATAVAKTATNSADTVLIGAILGGMMRLLATLLGLASLAAWQVPNQQVFRSATDAVPVYVSVIGRDGQQIRGLQQSDFTLLDNGKPQPVTFFSADRHPFAVALLLDTRFSMSVGPGLARQAEFARAIADALDTDDRVALGSTTRPLLQLSKDKTEASRQLRRPPMALAQAFARPGDEPSAAL